MKNFTEKNKFIFCTVIISFAFTILWSAYSVSHINGNLVHGKNASIIIYPILCFLFIFTEFLLNKSVKGVDLNEKLIHRLIICVATLLLIFSFYWFYTENSLFPSGSVEEHLRHQSEISLWFWGLLAALTYFAFNQIKDFKLNKFSRVLICLIVSAIMGISQYCPNPFEDTFGEIYHFDAYTNSIFNIMELNAYNDVNASIYGHYGLLYYSFVKLFGGGTIGVAIAISFFTFLSAASISYALNKLLKNDFLFLLTELSVATAAVMVFKLGTYTQMIPHRYLFPALLIFWCTVVVIDSNKKWTEYAGWALCSLSILWNTETGLVCTFAFGALCGIRKVKSNGLNYKIISVAFKIAASFIASIAIVNVYNVLTGGEINSIKTFIYPIMSETYNVNDLIAGVPVGPQFYIVEIIIFLIPISMTILKLSKNNYSGISKTDEIMLLSATIGLGCLTYYINRAAYANISICHFEILIILGVFCDYCYKKSDGSSSAVTKGELLLSKTVILLLTCLSMETVIYTAINLHIKQSTSWNMDSLNETLEEIKNKVPEDTYAYGPGVPIIYGLLGWDTQCAATDLEDFNNYSLDYIDSNLSSLDACFMNRNVSWQPLKNLAAFEVAAVFTVNNTTFAYYQRKVSNKGGEE